VDVDFDDRRASRGRTECRNPAQDERRLVDLLGSFLAATRTAEDGLHAESVLELLKARVLVGTSGWGNGSWRGPFFPMEIPAKHHLEYYASQFDTVELNGVLCRTPTAESVRRWRDQTGRHFVFAWKASKFITHWKRLGAVVLSLNASAALMTI
jgi:hypothetical protein